MACGDSQPRSTYFDREIAPILNNSCTVSGGGRCHVDDGTGRAMGNIDLSSFAAVQRRPDLLRRFGSYPMPLLLMKAIANPPQSDVSFTVGDVANVPLMLRHAGGPVLTTTSSAFWTLQRWMENGATETGLPPLRAVEEREPGDCTSEIRTDLFAQPTLDAVDIESEGYKRFEAEVWPYLHGGDGKGRGCLGYECHGVRDTNQVPTIELYFTCGDDEQQQRFNYLMARTYSGEGGRGQLTEKPLMGGSFHAGGKPWESVEDPAYQAIRTWSAMDPPFALQASEGEAFFQANVQPTLVAAGCYLEACHSLVNFNFYKPLAGTDGLFGTRVMLHNYLQARFMLGLESRDPKQGRLIKKNLVSSREGILHRGGPVLEPLVNCSLDVAAVRADPTRRWFEEVSPGCIVSAWHQLEREIAVSTGQLNADPGMMGVFVRRPPNPDRHIDFATYRSGADLLLMNFTQDATGRVTGLAGAPTSLLAGCGVDPSVADVRRPDIQLRSDGTAEIIFAMRTSASEGLDLWRVRSDGSNCERLGLESATDASGEPIHHFDPAYGPGGVILFASSRGDADHPDPERRYPSRTPKYFLPNSNIWAFSPGGSPKRLSYLSGAEFAPRILHSREVTYAVEKAAPDFYQISTRAIRLDDGGGYRPQIGQRDKMGYGQATEVRELVDFRTALICSDLDTYFGGGTLCVHDLSLGLEELAFQEVGFPHPVTVLDPAAAARPGQVGTGAYRSPTALPDGRILVAYSPGSVDLGDPAAAVDYGLWVVDPQGIEPPWQLYDSPGAFDIEPVVAFKRIFVPQPARVHQGDQLRGEYVFHSIPLFAALLNDNTRIETISNPEVTAIRVLEQMSPPETATSAADVASMLFGPQQVYMRRRLIGESPLFADGSIRVQVPPKTPLILELLDAEGRVVDWQREEEQISAGETQPRMIQEEMFDAVCGGCHNALDGSELGVVVGPDVITGASTRSEAAKQPAVDLYVDPAERVSVPFQ